MIQLVQTPKEFAPSTPRSMLDIFHATGRIPTMHRPIPAPEPDPEPNPGPDNIQTAPNANISSADWDALFHAITLRLERCVGVAHFALSDTAADSVPESLQARNKATTKVVLECVDAMKQLHAELQLERQNRPQTRQAQSLQQR
jgi:hypothetical protein